MRYELSGYEWTGIKPDVAEQASWRYLPSILFSLRPESRADRFRSPAA